MYKCIDISYFQGYNVDMQAVKNCGVEAVVCRAGQIESGVTSPDSTFVGNATNANIVDLPLGAYYTSGASSLEMALEEVNFLIDRLKPFKIDMPVYIDLEEDVPFLLSNANDVIQVYKYALEKAGYKCGVYASYDWFKNYIDVERWKDLALWIAQYNHTMTFTPHYFGMWQYTDSGSVAGIEGNVDINELYIKYWDRSIQTTPTTTTKSSLPVGVRYRVFIEGKGWSDWYYNGLPAGTEGLGLRLEKVCIELVNPNNLDLHINYKLHIQDIGWTDFVMDGVELGTFGKRIEGIQIILNGNDANKYDVNFRSHVQNIGTQNWAVDGELSGSEGGELRLEALAILIVNQGVDLGINGIESFSHIVKKTAEEVVNSPSYVQPTDANDGYGRYFTPDEFSCDCIKGYDIPDPCDGYPNTQYGTDPNLSPRLLEVLNAVREALGLPIIITCGTRCYSCNVYWGGVPDSCHRIGDAVDCYCAGMDIVEFAFFIANNYPDVGCRVYPNQGFLHIEVNTSLSGVYNQEQFYMM